MLRSLTKFVDTDSFPSRLIKKRWCSDKSKRRFQTLLSYSPGLFMSLVLAGCSQSDPGVELFPVEGKLLLKGKPLANALVVFHPKSSASDQHVPLSRGQTDAEGKFALSTFNSHDGAPEGEFAVTVQAYKLEKVGESFLPGPNIIAPKLSTAQTTDIHVKVVAGTNVLEPIEVRR